MPSSSLAPPPHAPPPPLEVEQPSPLDGASRGIVHMDQREHVLLRPDMYIGDISVVPIEQDVLVAEPSSGEVVCRRLTVECSPALLKCFDEAVVNAIDNQHRASDMRAIRVSVGADGRLEVSNDGASVPVTKHEGGALWTPTVAFSEFMSGTNFDDQQVRYTGGRNGVGVKSTNTWSLWFEVEIHDPIARKHFTQRFERNMAVRHPPVVRASSRKTGLTRVAWMPDYARMGMRDVAERGLTAELRALVEARVYDVCACTHPRIGVYLNGARLAIRSLPQYARLLAGAAGPLASDVVEVDGRALLQVCAAARDENAPARVVAFVNGVRCCAGTHVEALVRRIADVVLTRARAKAKRPELALRPAFLKQELTLVASLLVPNPRFTSQSKETLATPWKQVGFAWEPSGPFRSALERSPLVDRVVALASTAEERQLARDSGAAAGTTHRSTPRIAKYDPATGLFKRGDCSLIVTEGDSAKALAVAGLSVVGRQAFGVFPLRGKIPNVRRFPAKKVLENAEIGHLMAILGLTYGAVHTAESVRRLPYRRLVIFTDQDTDGSHIAGLLVNFLHAHHRSLLEVWPDFVQRFATPIVRARAGGGAAAPEQRFFSMPEFARWFEALPEEARARVRTKYYKGLGTSNNRDAKDYFARWDEHVTELTFSGAPCTAAIDVFFDEKLTAERKHFLSVEYDPESFVDYGARATTVERFLRDDMAHFSHADNLRSLPSAIDGLKPVQRKVLHAFFRKRQTAEIKVAQAGAMVAEATAYHHGETSVAEAIVGLAQDHVGTNNVALLWPEGQFGSRHMKPSEHAAPRYIFTRLDAIARRLFPPEDDPVLEYLSDDGQPIEPQHFVPLLPMVLVNGAQGIGTGWSTSLPNFDPRVVLAHCSARARQAAARETKDADDATEPTDAAEATDATDPTDETEPTDAAEATDATEPAAGTATDPATEEPVEPTDAAELIELTGDGAAEPTGVEQPTSTALDPALPPLVPWYAGFTGDFERLSEDAFLCSGRCERDEAARTLTVTELPIGRWTDDFLAYVHDKLVAPTAKEASASRFVRSVENLSTDTQVRVVLRCHQLPPADALPGLLKLTQRVSVSNVHLFGADGRLRRFDRPEALLDEHAQARLALYAKRRVHQIDAARHALALAANKWRFVAAVVDGSLDVRAFTAAELEEVLAERGFERLPTYAYLLTMSITSMTTDRLAALEADQAKAREALRAAEEARPAQMWLDELGQLELALQEYMSTKAEEAAASAREVQRGTKANQRKRKNPRA